MRFSIVTGPAQEPGTLSELKDHCRVTGSDQDGLLAGYLLAARAHLEEYSGCALITQTLDAYFDAFDGSELVLPRWPVQSVSSVTYIDTAGASQTLSGSYYVLDQRSRPARLVLADGYSWPRLKAVPNAITVRFVAGYAPTAVPDHVRNAVFLYARFLYDGNAHDRDTAYALMPRVFY